ncbi:MAG: hypothetical protein CSA65_05370 [Proteobacteria bacterium]|nr:MAG: hypothetical protein CSA65_05370 [Pseudomonadota bacterium]
MLGVDEPDPLIVEIAEGRAGAVAALIDRDGALVYGLARGLLADPLEAARVTTAVFDQVQQRAGQGGLPGVTTRGWLIRQTRDLSVERLRAGAQPAPPPDGPVDLLAPEPEHGAALRAILSNMAEPKSRILLDVWAKGRTLDDLAERRGVAAADARLLLRAALREVEPLLSARLRTDPDSEDGLEAAEHVLDALPPDEDDVLTERLPHDPALRAAAGAWVEALSGFADHVSDPMPLPPDLRSALVRSARRRGLAGLWDSLDGTALVVGSIIAVLVGWIMLQTGLLDGPGAPDGIWSAQLRGSAVAEVAVAPDRGVIGLRGPEVQDDQRLWIDQRGRAEVDLGPVGAPDADGLRIIQRSLDDITVRGAVLILRQGETEIARGALRD